MAGHLKLDPGILFSTKYSADITDLEVINFFFTDN